MTTKLDTAEAVLEWARDGWPTEEFEYDADDVATAERIAENERLRQWMEVWRADMDARGLPRMDWWEVAMRAALDEVKP